MTEGKYLVGCPAELWDGPYVMRCSLGGSGTVCAVHGKFELAKRCDLDGKCFRPIGHGGRCWPRKER